MAAASTDAILLLTAPKTGYGKAINWKLKLFIFTEIFSSTMTIQWLTIQCSNFYRYYYW